MVCDVLVVCLTDLQLTPGCLLDTGQCVPQCFTVEGRNSIGAGDALQAGLLSPFRALMKQCMTEVGGAGWRGGLCNVGDLRGGRQLRVAENGGGADDAWA